MGTEINALRLGQKNVFSQNANFTGALILALVPVDVKKLTFQANVRAVTGDENMPFVDFTPCDDFGKVKTFGDVDDCINWLRGAYLDITSVNIEIADMDTVTKNFVPPTDAIKNAVSKRDYYTRQRDAILPKVAKVQATVDADVASGWNLETAHPALQANYAEHVKQLQSSTAIKDFYVSEIARYQAIING
jgi:hypothetical protein